MMKILQDAIDKVKTLSPKRQAYAAEMLEPIAAAGDGVYRLSDEERLLVRQALNELDRGEVASEKDVRGVFDKYRGA